MSEELKKLGLYLENFDDWLGEKASHKYVILDSKGHHIAYADTLSAVRDFAATKQEQERITYQPSLF